MTDRDKIIKKLEECLSASCRGFRTCPYSDADWDAVREALALLKEQEPVKPDLDARNDWYRCGKCGNNLASGVRVRSFGIYKWPVYCEKCGKKVKWDD